MTKKIAFTTLNWQTIRNKAAANMSIHSYGFLLLVSLLILLTPACSSQSARYGEILASIEPDGSSCDTLANTCIKLAAAMSQKTFSVMPPVDEVSRKFLVKKSVVMTGYEIWIGDQWEQIDSCVVDRMIDWLSISGSDSMEIKGWVLLESARGASAKSVIAVALDGGPLFTSCRFDKASDARVSCFCWKN